MISQGLEALWQRCQKLGDRPLYLVLLLAALWLYGIGLGNMPLRDWDEGTRALIAREIWRSGHWLHPTQFGEPYLLKPPLMDWLVALSYHLGGVNEWTSRLPGAIASACGVPLLYGLGYHLFKRRSPALFSALVYLTLLPVVRHGRLLMLDGLVLSAMILSLLCLLKGRSAPQWSLGFGLGLGIIAFTKGLLMLPIAAIALLYICWDRHWATFRNSYIWLGLAIGFLPVSLWYGAQVQHYGALFTETHFFNQGFDRVISTVESHQHPPWFYLLEIVKYSAPWLLFLPQSIRLLWQERATTASKLILGGGLFYLGLISAMGTKLPWYVMPVYPFMALAIGKYLAQRLEKTSASSQLLKGAIWILAIACGGGGIYLAVSDPQLPLVMLAIILCSTFALSGWYWHQRSSILLLIFGLYGALSCLFMSQAWVWEINEAFVVKPIAAVIQDQTPTNSEVFTTFGYRRPSLDFYGDRPVLPKPLKDSFRGQYWLIDSGRFEQEQNSFPPHRILGRASGFYLVYFPSG